MKQEASIVEIGIPFFQIQSQMANDQRAGKRARRWWCNIKGHFQALIEVRKEVQIPFVLMTYLKIQ